MQNYIQQIDIILFGIEVKTFPERIKESFNILHKALGGHRPYYGISWFADQGIIKYYAMAAEMYADEAKNYNYETLTLQKGEYLTITVSNWLDKTDSIEKVFHELMKNKWPDRNFPCIEWYKSESEMVCMVNRNMRDKH